MARPFALVHIHSPGLAFQVCPIIAYNKVGRLGRVSIEQTPKKKVDMVVPQTEEWRQVVSGPSKAAYYLNMVEPHYKAYQTAPVQRALSRSRYLDTYPDTYPDTYLDTSYLLR